MKWTVTLVAETEPGIVRTHELGQIEREDTITPASLGLSIAEGKTMVAAIQTAIVTAQVKRHGESLRPCPHCAGPRTTKGYYTSIFRSVFGQVPMRVRRLRPCPCEATSQASASVLQARQWPSAPELLYLMAPHSIEPPHQLANARLDHNSDGRERHGLSRRRAIVSIPKCGRPRARQIRADGKREVAIRPGIGGLCLDRQCGVFPRFDLSRLRLVCKEWVGFSRVHHASRPLRGFDEPLTATIQSRAWATLHPVGGWPRSNVITIGRRLTAQNRLRIGSEPAHATPQG